MSAKVIHFLDNRIYGNLVLMVALRGVSCGRQGVAFVNDKECLPGLAGLLGDDIECLIKKRAHLSDFARSPDSGAELEEHSLLPGFARQPVTRAFGSDRFSGADIAREDHEGVS